MQDVCPVEQIPADNLHWHKPRIKLFANTLLALIAVNNLNLVKIATTFPERAGHKYNYKHLHRLCRSKS